MNSCASAEITIAAMRRPRSSADAGCHCCRHRVTNACQSFSAAARGGTARNSRRSISATKASAGAPVIVPSCSRKAANQARHPGGNSPGGCCGRSDQRCRRRRASISSAEENILEGRPSPCAA